MEGDAGGCGGVAVPLSGARRDGGEAELAMVVVRPVTWFVSAEGGGGRDASTEARHRKHSPLPKYVGAGWGMSER